MRKAVPFFAVLTLSLSSSVSFAQDGFFTNWFNMATATQSEQPHWMTPLATTTPRLEQEYRFDYERQTHNDGIVTENYGETKGLEIIPYKSVEIILAEPAYVTNNPDSPNGFGDWQFLVKYRIAARNEQHGNYVLTAFFQMTLPTGQYTQGSPSPVITPTIAYGKGFGNFDEQGTLGYSMPTGNVSAIGHNLTWNNTFQYHFLKKFWPETELNYTRYYYGEHGGHQSIYATPGLLIGRSKIKNRLAVSFGAGFQIALTSFHPTNHIPIVSVRFPF